MRELELVETYSPHDWGSNGFTHSGWESSDADDLISYTQRYRHFVPSEIE